METLSTTDLSCSTRISDISELEVTCLLKEKYDALSSMDFIELEDTLSLTHEDSFEASNATTEYESSNIILISTRTNCKFSSRLNERIQELSNKEMYNKLHNYFYQQDTSM